jgi:hypothetical protein
MGRFSFDLHRRHSPSQRQRHRQRRDDEAGK